MGCVTRVVQVLVLSIIASNSLVIESEVQAQTDSKKQVIIGFNKSFMRAALKDKKALSQALSPIIRSSRARELAMLTSTRLEAALSEIVGKGQQRFLSFVDSKVIEIEGNSELDLSSPDIEFLKSINLIKFVEFDHKRTRDAFPSDPGFSQQQHLHNTGAFPGFLRDVDINAPEAWNTTTTTGDAVIAVIDSGVDLNHQDLRENLYVNVAERNGRPNIDDDGNGYIDDINGCSFSSTFSRSQPCIAPQDTEGHGTSVTGVIAARGNNGIGVSGVAWNSQVVVLKDDLSLISLVNALEFVYAMRDEYRRGTGRGANIRVVNISSSGPFSVALSTAVERLIEVQTIVVASAGNNGRNIDEQGVYPAAFTHSNIISVAAVDNAGRLASFSNYGHRKVDIAAPGVEIITTGIGSYVMVNGTSFSAPQVAAHVAILWNRYPNLTIVGIKEIIFQSRKDETVLPVLGNLKGFLIFPGIIDIAESLNLASLPRAVSWKNPVNQYDVNADGRVSGLDALVIINRLISYGSCSVSDLPGSPPNYFDANGDGRVSGLDALVVINQLNRRVDLAVQNSTGSIQVIEQTITADRETIKLKDLLGNTDLDNDVDLTDINNVRANFGRSGAPGTIPGDVNLDGTVNLADLNAARANFGATY